MQSEILDKIDVEETKKTALLFNITIDTAIVDEKVVIILPANKSDLKKILRFLDEDYYQSILLSKPFLSNSKKPA